MSQAQAAPGGAVTGGIESAVANRVLLSTSSTDWDSRSAGSSSWRSRGPHPCPDRGPHRNPPGHREIPHPSHARTPAESIGGGRCSTARLSSWPWPPSASRCPPRTPRTWRHAPECRAEVASLQRAVDLLAVPELAAPGALGPAAAPVWAADRGGHRGAEGTVGSRLPEAARPLADVVPLRSRRPRPWLLAVAAAVVRRGGRRRCGRGAGRAGTTGTSIAGAAELDPLGGQRRLGHRPGGRATGRRRSWRCGWTPPPRPTATTRCCADRAVDHRACSPLGIARLGHADLRAARRPRPAASSRWSTSPWSPWTAIRPTRASRSARGQLES